MSIQLQTALGRMAAESGPGRLSPAGALAAAGFGPARARPGDKPDRHDFCLTRRPPPAACLRIADNLAAYRDGSDLIVPA